ncbi:MAG: hypothetical protein HKN05_15690 [Rhizobiales bacterium]|nr:hypothetical protein [Hyphomicrobiales bacterium]
MLIAQISDSHISHQGPFDSERIAALGACVDHINRLDPQPALVVHTGDVVHNGTEIEYEMAAEHLNRLEADLWVIPGNKDHRARLQEALPEACSVLNGSSYLQYVVDLPTARLIFLDTSSSETNKGRFCEKRLAHFDQELSKATKPVVLFMHHPPFEVTTAPEPFQFEAREPVEKLEKVLAKHPPLVGIFAGHMHRHFETTWAGVPALTMTAGAIDLRKGSELGALQTEPYFCLTDVSPEGTVATTLMRAAPQD